MMLTIIIWGSVITIVAIVVRSIAVTMPILGDRRTTKVARQTADDDARRMRDILTQALKESTNDAEFEASYRDIVAIPELVRSPFSWHAISYTLFQYRRGGEVAPAPRICAERYLKDLTRNLARSSSSTA